MKPIKTAAFILLSVVIASALLVAYLTMDVSLDDPKASAQEVAEPIAGGRPLSFAQVEAFKDDRLRPCVHTFFQTASDGLGKTQTVERIEKNLKAFHPPEA